MPTYSSFISYVREDAELARKVQDILKANGLSYWIDQEGITYGQEWEREIRRGLTQSDALLAIVTSKLPGSFVQKEIEIAREIRSPIIPILIDSTIDDDHKVCELLRKYEYVDWRQGVDEEQLVEAVNKNHLCPVVSIYNVKGGVGKTTLAANLSAYYFNRANKKVLVIDMDPQANLTTTMVGPPELSSGNLFKTVRRVSQEDFISSLRGSRKSVVGMMEDAVAFAEDVDREFELENYTLNLQNRLGRLDIVIGDPKLRSFTTNFRPIDVKRAIIGFAKFIGQCRKRYDSIFIDLNPSISNLTKCALESSTHVLSPVRPDNYALQGLNLLDDFSLETSESTRGREHLVVINDPEQDSDKLVRRKIAKSKYGANLLKSEIVTSRHFYAKPNINVSSPLNQLPAMGQWSLAPNGARKSLQSLAEELAEKIGLTV